MTNYEKIISMNLEELASCLISCNLSWCAYDDTDGLKRCENQDMRCEECCYEWLQEEANLPGDIYE